MNITPFTVYLIGIADNVSNIFIFFAIVSVIALLIFAANTDDFDAFKNSKFAPRMVTILLTCATISMLMPKTKLLATMFVLPRIAESEAIKRDLPEIYDLAIKCLKDKLKPETP